MLHFAGPPTVGGVEAVIAHHARQLAALGYPVRVISGAGENFDPAIETHIAPLFGSSHPDILAAKRKLDAGMIPPAFAPLVDSIARDLHTALDNYDVLIAHNTHTMNKNLPLTAALRRVTSDLNLPTIAWCHDIAAANEQYQAELHGGFPWSLLCEAWSETRYVTVSEPRRAELAAALNLPPDQIDVITAGVDLAAFYQWTPAMRELNERLHLADADALLLLPARLTRRKNIELGLRVLAALRERTGGDHRLIITGPPGPHNPGNMSYWGELLALRRDLALETSAHFLYAFDGYSPDDSTIANLYVFCDALLFPSVQEGFGIPMLEAGLARLPIFCADLPPLRATARDDAHYFDPLATPTEDIAAAIAAHLESSPVYRLRRRTRQEYRWEAIVRERVVELVESDE
jgi:glycosyltransferase involved in cell wall biosynthesis